MRASGGRFLVSQASLTPPTKKRRQISPQRRSTSGRYRCANAVGEIRRIIGRLRNLVDEGTSPQFFERQIRVHPTGVVEIAVDQPIERMANVELAGSTGGVRITYDVDRAAIGQQMIELRPVGKFIDPLEINQQQFA